MNRRTIVVVALFSVMLAPMFAQQTQTQTQTQMQQQEDPDVAKARQALQEAEARLVQKQAEQDARKAEEQAREAAEKRIFDIPRLLTVWDQMEKALTPQQMKAFDAEDKNVKTPQDVINLFTKFYPAAYDVKADLTYVDPATLIPAQNANDPKYAKYQEFAKWRTHPVGPEVKGLDDLRAHGDDVLYDLDHTPLEQVFPAEQARKIRDAWKRRTILALNYNWPWALGIAKVDVLGPIQKMGTYKKDGQYHVEIGMLNRLKGRDAIQPVMRLWLSEVRQIAALAYKCRNGFIEELEEPPKFTAEVLGPSCKAVIGQPTEFSSDSQRGIYSAEMDTPTKLEFRNQLWTINSAIIKADSLSTEVFGSHVQALPATNKLLYEAEARKETTDATAPWYKVSCSIDLTRHAPPQALPPTVNCGAMRAVIGLHNNHMHVTVPVAGNVSMVGRVDFYLDQPGNVVYTTHVVSKSGEYEFASPVMDYAPHSLGVVGYDPAGNKLFECPGDLTVTRPTPPVTTHVPPPHEVTTPGKSWCPTWCKVALVFGAVAIAGVVYEAGHHKTTPPASTPADTKTPPHGCTVDPVTGACVPN